MPTTKKPAQKKNSTAAARTAGSNVKQRSIKKKSSPKIKPVVAQEGNTSPRSPHRSFRRTYRRDYALPLGLPGYIPFTLEVLKTLWRYKKTFMQLVAVYAVVSGLIVGFISQTTYSELGELLRSTGSELFSGDGGQLAEAGTLLMVGLSGGLGAEIGEAEQLLGGLLVLLTWLVTVWMLRALLAGHKPKVRDGFYNAGAPIVPTIILALVLILQLVPAAIAAIGISAAIPTGLVSDGIEAMLFWVVAMLLIVLSLYWITSTFFALIIVTLPGMYPFRALKSAQDLVSGRRLPILLRIVWLFLVTLLLWVLVMIPVIVFDAWLKGVWEVIDWLPIVPVVWLIAGSASVIWTASYIYLLYRKVVDSGTASV